jgi:hypothetical protein
VKTSKPKLLEFFLAGIALAFLVGAVLVVRHSKLDTWHMVGAAAVITFLSYCILAKPASKPQQPVWVAEADAGTVPRYGSRRWARACYHSDIISLEELNQFYAANPEDQRDPDR